MALDATGSVASDSAHCLNVQAVLSKRGCCKVEAGDADDMTLIEGVRDADKVAMSEIFDRYSRSVFFVAVRILKDNGDAEDVMQEIFIRLWQNSDSFMQTRGSLRGWLMAVTRNRSIDVLRRRRPTDTLEEVILVSSCNQATVTEHNDLVAKVFKAMESLPLGQQEALRMAFFEDLTHVEIAELTGEALGSVKYRIRLALITLRKQLAI